MGWVGLGPEILGWVELGFEKVTHDQLCSTVQYSRPTVLYSTVLYSTVLYCTVLYCIVLNYTILYYTIHYIVYSKV